MAIPSLTHVVCVTETELIQWFSRGRIHILMDRVFVSGELVDGSIFAACSALKLDDAKARVLVSLSPDWLSIGNLHPAFRSRKILSLPLSAVRELAPTLPQYRRRLESFNLPMAEWSAEEEWNLWLVDQSAHERETALIDVAVKNSYESSIFLLGNDLVGKIIRIVTRPQSHAIVSTDLLDGWMLLISRRDEILKKLRFEGHNDRSSFFRESFLQISCQCYGCELSNPPDLPSKDSGWVLQDLCPETINYIKNESWPCDLKLSPGLNLFVAATYLRIFDELFYGSADWKIVSDLIQFIKNFMNRDYADMLTLAVLGSYSADEIRSLDLRDVFKNQDSNLAASTDLHAIGQATPIDLVHPTDPVVSTAQGGNSCGEIGIAKTENIEGGPSNV